MSWNSYRFNRMEWAGSVGDLGTLLPLAIGMVAINGLSPVGIFFCVGVFYILAGAYYRTPIAVQPMKVIGAYAVATAITAQEVQAAGLLMAVVLLLIGLTGVITRVARLIPRSAIRGVQAATGTLLAMQGVRFITGQAGFKAGTDPFSDILLRPLWGVAWPCVLIGVVFAVGIMLLLRNKQFPAGLVAVVGGMLLGLAFGGAELLSLAEVGLYFPTLLPYGLPSWDALGFALLAMVLPQAPMTVGNAVVAYADLSQLYFPKAERCTPRAVCLSMAGANVLGFLFGGMPMCHGAGGLAAHYQFGARTAGSNLIIGGIFLALTLFLGPYTLNVVQLIPAPVLGALLFFAGLQLCLAVADMNDRKSLFIIFSMVACTLAMNLAVAFAVGWGLARLLESERFSV